MTGILIWFPQRFLVRYKSHPIIAHVIMANLILELISDARISTIGSLISVVEYFIKLYLTRDIKCRIYTPPPGPRPRFCSGLPGCDAGILGSLLTLRTTLGIHPIPLPPYKGFSVKNLALGIKGLPYSSRVNQGHGGCSINGELVRRVDEVLAEVDRLDIWNSTWGQGAGNSHEEEQRWRHDTWFKFAFLREKTPM